MEIPAWVSEGSLHKYHRAVAQLVKDKLPVTEEATKALYVKWAGRVLDVPVVEDLAAVEVAPKPRRTRKAE